MARYKIHPGDFRLGARGYEIEFVDGLMGGAYIHADMGMYHDHKTPLMPIPSIKDLYYLPALPDESESIKENPPVTDTIESKRATIARLEQEITALENQPKDNRPDGAIIKFSKRYPGGVTDYDYAAIKKNDKWYITGRGNSGGNGVPRKWETLLSFIGEKDWHTITDMIENDLVRQNYRGLYPNGVFRS